MRRKRGEKQAYDDTVVTNGDITVLQVEKVNNWSLKNAEFQIFHQIELKI